ncbi:MAG: hypothetical protein ACOY0S_01255 [Patescibacteria group bacterium]
MRRFARKLKRLVRVQYWRILLVVFTFAVGSTLIFFLGQPATGEIKYLSKLSIPNTISNPTSLWDKARQEYARKVIKSEEAEKSREGTTVYSGKYISFSYPNTYFLKTKESSESGTLERIILLGQGAGVRKLAVTLTQTDASSISDVSAVQARRLKTKIYLEKPFDIFGQKGLVFEKVEGGFEKTAIFLKERMLLIFSLTASDKQGELETEFDFISNNFTFSPP